MLNSHIMSFPTRVTEFLFLESENAIDNILFYFSIYKVKAIDKGNDKQISDHDAHMLDIKMSHDNNGNCKMIQNVTKATSKFSLDNLNYLSAMLQNENGLMSIMIQLVVNMMSLI